MRLPERAPVFGLLWVCGAKTTDELIPPDKLSELGRDKGPGDVGGAASS